jgi:hypothetical protein
MPIPPEFPDSELRERRFQLNDHIIEWPRISAAVLPELCVTRQAGLTLYCTPRAFAVACGLQIMQMNRVDSGLAKLMPDS